MVKCLSKNKVVVDSSSKKVHFHSDNRKMYTQTLMWHDKTKQFFLYKMLNML